MPETRDGQSLEANLAAWIGRRSEREDVLDERLIAEFRATLEPHLAAAASVPPGLFWCLAPDIEPARQLGGDGHSRLGLFLPDVGLPRRMWAGGELRFHGDFSPGDKVTKAGTVEDVVFKSGKSGRLCFVTLANRYSARGQLLLEERQDIVYRAPVPQNPDVATLESATEIKAAPGDWLVAPAPNASLPLFGDDLQRPSHPL